MQWYFDIFRVLSLAVTWVIPAALVLAVGVFVLVSPVLTLAGVGIKLYDACRARLGTGLRAKMRSMNLVCFIEDDCPFGHICVNGRCLPVKAPPKYNT